MRITVLLCFVLSIIHLQAKATWPTDTLSRVSMIFSVHHGTLNSLDIKHHPVFKNNPGTYLFSSVTEVPEGLSFSEDGLISWSPGAEQFRQLQTNPLALQFYAQSTSGNIIPGQIRVIAQGDVVTVDTAIVQQPSADSLPASTTDKPLSLQLPDFANWDTRKEGETFSFELNAAGGNGEYQYQLLKPDFLTEVLNPNGFFSWTPDFDFVSNREDMKSVLLTVKVRDFANHEITKHFSLYVQHVNRPPTVSELPIFYIQFNSQNTYELNKEGLVFDPDGDSIIFKPVLKELPQGMNLNRRGQISWKPSRRQFNYLRSNPLYLSFTVEDYPKGSKTIGQIRIEVSQQDLPPQITMIPNKEKFEIKENDELQLSFFINDPNGEDDLLSFGFVSENGEIKDSALKKQRDGQYKFSWTPGYDFIKQKGDKEQFTLNFFAIDRESNRSEKNILVEVEDTENLLEKDRILYDQYRTVLERAWDLITQLNEKEKELEKKYKLAKKGKKNRAITTASLGALTGLSPIIFLENPDGQKITAGLGGTATATLGTLEASNVIGEPPSDIMRDLNYVSQKRNDLLIYGNVFASKYALPLIKREQSFQSDLRSLTIHLNLKDVAKLEMDATWENSKKATAKNIKKVFKDFNVDKRFEKDYK